MDSIYFLICKFVIIICHLFRFEIVVTLTGGSKSTGQITEERTSYLSKEIMWGYRFNNNIVSYDPTNEVYVTNYENFDQTEEVIRDMK